MRERVLNKGMECCLKLLVFSKYKHKHKCNVPGTLLSEVLLPPKPGHGPDKCPVPAFSRKTHSSTPLTDALVEVGTVKEK